MTTAIAQAGAPHPFGALRAWWGQRTPQHQTATRVVAVLAMVIVAYHYSLFSLLQSLGQETPLAYVGLVPVIALVIAALRVRTARPGPAIHDRQVDYIVGVPFLAVALVINFVFPRRMSTMFWLWRIDLLSLPFFVAGALCVVFGIRTMWKQRLAIAYLFLAWPLPYQVLMLRFLNGFTNLTLSALKVAIHLVPIATVVPVADGSLFQIVHGRPFQISVVSACSGVNGIVGFLLVAAAFGAIVRGPKLRKGLWLSGGLLLLWFMNLARILFIFWAGQQWGSGVAIGFFHPFVGLISFNLGIVAMLLLLKPFGLSIDGAMWGETASLAASTAAPANESTTRPHRLIAVPRVGLALGLVVVLAGTLAFTNENLKSFDLVANALGTPRLASFSDYPSTPDGWRAELSDQYDWAKPYFGQSSTWLRYAMFPGTAPDVPLHSDQPVTADVISTSSVRTFSAYGVDACYRFHGYRLRDIASVSLGGGVAGQALSFYNGKQQQDWTVVYWIWPVRTATTTRYERVTLYIQDSGKVSMNKTKVTGVQGISGGLSTVDAVDRKLVAVRSFLTEFARQIVRNQTTVRVGTVLPAENLAVNNTTPNNPAAAPGSAAPATSLTTKYPWLRRTATSSPPASSATSTKKP